MTVREGMTSVVLTVGPSHSLCDIARQMAAKHVGAAVVMDPEAPGPGILTERDILKSVAAGEDPSRHFARDHMSDDITFASPDWSLEQASETMVKNNFRHLLVVDQGELAGIISMRDIVSAWVRAGTLAA